jgi:CheY-like chemotaxis protein
VTFSLPCGAESLPAPKPVPDHKCLILTPDDIGAGVAARYLAELGISARLSAVVHRASAVAAAASAAGQPYDFVLMDARISPAPGEALAAIREASGTRLPAAVLIEPGNRKSVPALREMGFDAFLVRPLRRASLLRIGGALLLGDGEFRVDPVVGDRATYRLAPQPVRALKVLVVDDNEINALLLRAIVERLGHHVEEARDGQAALAVASEHRCDLVLLDLDLPGMDGLSVARAIRGSGTRRPTLVAITGMNAADLESDAYDAGFDGFLEKPVDPGIVRDLIERMRVPGAA